MCNPTAANKYGMPGGEDMHDGEPVGLIFGLWYTDQTDSALAAQYTYEHDTIVWFIYCVRNGWV